MGYCRQTSLPKIEPVSLEDAKEFMRLPAGFTRDDRAINGLIQAAREQGEILSCRALAQRTFTQVLDAHPYYADTAGSQLAFPPSSYSLPLYSSTMWNYSQMIKLGMSPVISIQKMTYVGADNASHVMNQDVDFILDRITEPARIFPVPGQYWPADLYVANAVQIDFTAGYDPDPGAVDDHDTVQPGQQQKSVIVTGIPQMLWLGILNLVSFWYENRGAMGDVPARYAQIFMNHAVIDFAPTRA